MQINVLYAFVHATLTLEACASTEGAARNSSHELEYDPRENTWINMELNRIAELARQARLERAVSFPEEPAAGVLHGGVCEGWGRVAPLLLGRKIMTNTGDGKK